MKISAPRPEAVASLNQEALIRQPTRAEIVQGCGAAHLYGQKKSPTR